MLTSLIMLMLVSSPQEPASLDTLPTKESYLVEVVTASEEIYDDGVYRKRYAPFTVSDSTGVVVLRIAAKYDRPAVIALPKGKFLLRTKIPALIEKFIIIGNSPTLKVIL
ncbi:MAG: hypothetical protein IPJ75_14680 [Ignavibacteriales bacterium]|nr:hypothetical protein [Ignavibacteriales bacterium]